MGRKGTGDLRYEKGGKKGGGDDYLHRWREKVSTPNKGVSLSLEIEFVDSPLSSLPLQGESNRSYLYRREVSKALLSENHYRAAYGKIWEEILWTRHSPSIYEQIISSQILYEILWQPHSPGILDDIWNAIVNIPKNLARWLKKVFEDVLKGVFDIVKKAFTPIFDVFKGIWDGLTKGIHALLDIFGKIGKGIWESIKKVGKWIAETATELFNLLIDFFKKYWPWILGILVLVIVGVLVFFCGPEIKGILQPIIDPLFAFIGGPFKDAVTTVGKGALSIGKIMSNTYSGFMKLWLEHVKPSVDAIQKGMQALTPVVQLFPHSIYSKIGNSLLNEFGLVFGKIALFTQLVDRNLAPLQKRVDTLREAWNVEKEVYSTVYTKTTTALAQIEQVNYLQQEEENRRHLTKIFGSYNGEVVYAVEANRDWEKAILQFPLPNLKPVKFLGLKLDFMKPIQGVLNWLTKAASRVIQGVNQIIGPPGPASPMTAPASAGKALVFATGAGMASHLMASITEAAYPTKELGLNYLAGLIVQFAGYATIVSATTGEMIKRTIRYPYGYKLNKDYRPFIPKEQVLEIMAVKPDIEIEDFREAMRWLGYREEWIKAIERTMYHEPKYFELSLMASDASADPKWLYTKARRAGYTPEDAVIFAESLRKRALSRERQTYQQSLLALYKNGLISEELFDEQLKVLGLREDAHELLKRAADFMYLNDYANDMVSFFQELYLGEEITDEELKQSLIGLGYREDRASILANTMAAKKNRTVTRKERKEIEKTLRKKNTLLARRYILMYRNGTIGKGDLIAYLITVGYTPEFANTTADIEELKKIQAQKRKESHSKEAEERRIREKYEKAYIKLFQEDKITAEELYNRLIKLGYSEEYAKAEVEYEKAKKGGTVKVLREADPERFMNQMLKKYRQKILDRYREGFITETRLRYYLSLLGCEDEEIERILEDEKVWVKH